MTNSRTEQFTYRFGKRILDLVVSGLVLVVLAPLLALIAAALKLSSSAPVLFETAARGAIGQKILDLQVHNDDALEHGR